MLRHASIALALFSLLLSFGLKAEPKTYPIHEIGKQGKEGDRFRLKFSSKRFNLMRMKQGKKTVQEKKLKDTWTADVVTRNLMVNAEGRPTLVQIKVERLTRKEGKKKKAILPKGAVISARLENGEPVFEAKGRELTDLQKEGLGQIAAMALPPVEGDAMLPKKAVAAGERWELDQPQISRRLAKIGMNVWPEDIQGGGRILKTRRYKKKPVVEFTVDMKIDKMGMNLKNGIVLDETRAASRRKVTAAPDKKRGFLYKLRETSTMDFHGASPQGLDFVLKSSNQIDAEVTKL